MTPEETARFILSDCRDPELLKKANAEMDADHAEAMKDPAYKAAWDANLKAFADRLDDRIIEKVYGEVYGAELHAYRQQFAADAATHANLSNAERIALGIDPLP